MIESPVLREIIAERMSEAVMDILLARFGSSADGLETEIKAINDDSRLREFLKSAATGRSPAAFRKKLSP
jgi:hypothetical protein